MVTYEKKLDRLADLLRNGYLTARDIAKRMKCSRIQAYRRLNALRELGVSLSEKKVREKPTGPLSRAFTIDGN